MTKRSKILVFVLLILLILLVALYILVNAVYEKEPEQVVYPQGELVDSVFVAQNNQYIKNESLSNTYSFSTVPYMVDMPVGSGAKIGTGTIFQLSGGYFAYATEYTDQYDVQDIIASQFPAALLINYIPERTLITTQATKTGYINGFRAEYLADSLFVTDGTANQQAMILGYVADLPEGVYYGNHMFIAVGSTTMTTESAAKCEAVLSVIMKTLRYDEQLDLAMTRQREADKEEQELEKQRTEEELAAAAEQQSVEEPAENLTIVGDEVTASIPIELATPYENFTLTVDWTMSNPNAVLELFFPDGQSYCTPYEQNDYHAAFSLPSATAGYYTLRVKNYQECGQINPTVSGAPVGVGE